MVLAFLTWVSLAPRNCLAMQVRRDDESLNALHNRLNTAIDLARSKNLFIDELNDGCSSML